VEMTGVGAAVENSRLALWVVQARHRVSHRRPHTLGNRQKRDSHIPTAPATVLPIHQEDENQNYAPFGRHERKIPAASWHPKFQDHLVLESKSGFRIILRLENASPTFALLNDKEASRRNER